MEETPNIEELKSRLNIGVKLWLEFENSEGEHKNILGSGWAKLLVCIDQNKDGSLTQAANECNYSYKYAWNILKRIEERTGAPVATTGKGGRGGGGWVKLNDWGKTLLEIHKKLDNEIKLIKENLDSSLRRD